MWKTLRPAAALLVFFAVFGARPAFSQEWSFGAGAGEFVFGRFIDRTFTVGNETGSTTTHNSLSAANRPGVSVDFERGVNDWLGVRLEGTFAHAPLRVRSRSNDNGVNLDAGSINVTTIMLPLVIHFNHKGAFRFHIMGGPAYAMYDIKPNANSTGSNLGVFEGARSRWGVAAGGGVGWWLSDRFAVEGQITDIVTSSPFKRSDLPANTIGVDIPKPQNVHTTVGVRWKF